MLIQRVPTTNSIDDIKFIGENDLERQFIQQLAESGTLSCVTRQVGDSILFRPISVSSELSSYTSSNKSISQYNFEIRQNQDFTVDISFKKDGSILDLSQFLGIKLQVKHSKSAPAIIELNLNSGLAVSIADTSVLKIAITAEQSKLLTCESYYYDILMSKQTSNVYYLEGKITVKNTGTR